MDEKKQKKEVKEIKERERVKREKESAKKGGKRGRMYRNQGQHTQKTSSRLLGEHKEIKGPPFRSSFCVDFAGKTPNHNTFNKWGVFNVLVSWCYDCVPIWHESSFKKEDPHPHRCLCLISLQERDVFLSRFQALSTLCLHQRYKIDLSAKLRHGSTKAKRSTHTLDTILMHQIEFLAKQHRSIATTSQIQNYSHCIVHLKYNLF